MVNKKYSMKLECDYYRITALRDFGNVKTGDIGGLIEKEENLSHEGDCWIEYKALVCENVRIYGNAEVRYATVICGDVGIGGDMVINEWLA